MECRQPGFKKIWLLVTEKFRFILTSSVTDFGWLLISHWEVLFFPAVLLHCCGILHTRKLTSLLISPKKNLTFFFSLVAEIFVFVPDFEKVNSS